MTPNWFCSSAILCAALFFITGCGNTRNTGEYNISGKITFDGQSVPKGMVTFSPDTAKGNSGASGFAEIVDGKFDTSGSEFQGIAGGAYRVRIEAYDGVPIKSDDGAEIELGTPLFAEHIIEKNFDNADSVLDLVLTKDDVLPVR